MLMIYYIPDRYYLDISERIKTMAKPYKARNKRIIQRSSNGRFRKTTFQDIGLMGICQTCGHFLMRHYDGNPEDPMIDPRLFRNRCFTCEPRSPEEQKRFDEKIREKQEKMSNFFEDILKEIDS